MRIVIKKAGQYPEVKEIENDLDVFHAIVGGYIETVSLVENILCVCNEEGKIKGLPMNMFLNGDMIVGDVFFCAFDGEDFTSLDDNQIAALINSFVKLERYRRDRH